MVANFLIWSFRFAVRSRENIFTIYLVSQSFQILNSVFLEGATEFTLKIGLVNLENQVVGFFVYFWWVFLFQRCLKLLWKAQGTEYPTFFTRTDCSLAYVLNSAGVTFMTLQPVGFPSRATWVGGCVVFWSAFPVQRRCFNGTEFIWLRKCLFEPVYQKKLIFIIARTSLVPFAFPQKFPGGVSSPSGEELSHSDAYRECRVRESVCKSLLR